MKVKSIAKVWQNAPDGHMGAKTGLDIFLLADGHIARSKTGLDTLESTDGHMDGAKTGMDTF